MNTPNLCLLEVDGPTATITLNRPEARNALNLELLQGLLNAYDNCVEAGVGIVVLRAEGSVFCAGADVRSDDGSATGQPGLRRSLIEQVITRLQHFPVSIASVQGPAVGGGWGLAFAADVVLVSEDATFRFPELALGFLPPAPLVSRFVEVAGPVRSTRLLGSGETIPATSALLTGLVETVPADDLHSRTRELVDGFARSQPNLLPQLRELVRISRATATTERHAS